ncbi:transporter substrate-binding domain-containing protein [Pararhizobium mangrovi]|uniref:Transporter substrate-binding domain-containing protein n=1 Tax=Pararhizobium mangrovi TaxID=2590452 RepID=A0A506U4K1_9HYPH|nr:transporter substrate-binding domain-containing protein [Pararhizobium mangrovi]TPW27974.1 transporter substrate-binding domain-containing protein [Pararhizobium mangrovi]
MPARGAAPADDGSGERVAPVRASEPSADTVPKTSLPADGSDGSSDIPAYFHSNERLSLPDLSGYERIRFLTTTDFPPFNFIDQTGRLTGFNIDLARGLCEELDIVDRCQIQALPFDDLTGALSTGKGEAVIAGLAVTQKQRERFTFTRSYLHLPARFVRNRATSLDGTPAIALSGKPVGVVKGSAHAAMLRAFFPKLAAKPFDTADAMLDALRSRKIDAAFGDGVRLSFWLSSKQAKECCAFFGGPYLSEHFLGHGLAIAVDEKHRDLAEAFDHALLSMTRDGRFAEIYQRYFPSGLY